MMALVMTPVRAPVRVPVRAWWCGPPGRGRGRGRQLAVHLIVWGRGRRRVGRWRGHQLSVELGNPLLILFTLTGCLEEGEGGWREGSMVAVWWLNGGCMVAVIMW